VGTVGIIANPASGKDIRRLVAHGSTFDNNEKINIVRRVLLALDAVGVTEVRYMPDTYGLVPRAAAPLTLSLRLTALPMPVLNNAGDSFEAARRLSDGGCGCLITLGGDGTNRVIAKGCGNVPLVPISTGTNNVFPRMIEGTVAGLAAGLVATGAVPDEQVVQQEPRLDVILDGTLKEIALIDVATTQLGWIGARALWEPAQLAEVVISRISASEIGMCSLGGALFPDLIGTTSGVHAVIGANGRQILAPLAPGLLRHIPIANATCVQPDATVQLRSAPCTVALDGEREFEIIEPGHQLEVVFNPRGPRVVDIDEAMRAGAVAGVLERRHALGADAIASS
jgi:predicted polyphosphate/ATP-dependent NAD kinase